MESNCLAIAIDGTCSHANFAIDSKIPRSTKDMDSKGGCAPTAINRKIGMFQEI